MTSRERVERVFRGEPADRVPFDIPFVFPEFRRRWSQHTGLPGDSLEDHCRLDCFEVAADHSPWPGLARVVSDDGGERITVDGFGQTCREKPGTGLRQVLDVAIKEKSDLGKADFESACSRSRYAAMEKTFLEKKDRFWVYAKVGGPYSRAKFLRGESEFLMDLATDEAFAGELVGRVTDLMTEVGLESIRRLAGITAIHVHDDFASTHALMFSPRTYRRVFLPAMARMASAFHEAGVHVIYGGEGYTSQVLPWLVDAGFDAFICLEPRAGSDIVELRGVLGDEAVFFGNMCNTVVLPRGTKDEIRAMVLRHMRLAREGRCIVGPSHSVSGEVPPENFEYLWRLIHEWAPWDAPLPPQ